ncbi:putative ribonuclease H-like domain-containing protein [Tanacetum coccineum]
MNKIYCLVVTDDYSRFTWVLFLASKDETSGILKSFITQIENLVDKKVKIIRCDNGTEFKNRVISEFCEKKGIKREFSVARNPQQNGVAERRNRTLIEAAGTISITPSLSFMKPFGCHVTILNTLDHLGKFDGKSDDGFFVGYSLNSKAFRVYNIRTRKVEENLHVRFLEDKPIIAGDGPKWLFDIDVLTKSMNYVPVVEGTNSNDSVDGSLFYSSSKNASNDEPQPCSDDGKKDDKGVSKASGIDDQERPKNSTQDVNNAGSSINTASTNVNIDMSNITTTYLVPSIPNTRIHKDHSLDHVIGDIQSGVLTRIMTKTSNEQGFISAVYEGKTHEDLHTCLFSCFLSQVEPKKGFEDPEFPDRVYKVEKALYGLHQAHRAWNEMCTEFEKMMHKKFQMSSMGELTFFLGLQVTQKDDGIFISQDKYVDEILKKFGFSTVKTASTPMETSKPLLKDAEAEDVDVHLYRSMIGSLMYLTALRPDIMFVVCACARFQVTPKVSHLHAMKRIFRYLKGQPKLGLWYPKDSPFDLEAYTDSDYAGASLDRKSTTKTIVANSTTEAEYVAAASCCGQVLWFQNQILDYGYNFMNTNIFIDNESTICIVKNLVFQSKTNHIEIRHHFVRDSNEKKLIQMIKIYTDQNVADFLTKAFDVGRFQYLIASIGMLNL